MDNRFNISFDQARNVLVAVWSGYQNLETIKKGGEAILEAVKKHGCGNIINDNTNVKGTWSFAFEWAANEWFPSMVGAGLKSFAWILSPDTLANKAVMTVTQNMDTKKELINIFNPGAYTQAYNWIQDRNKQ